MKKVLLGLMILMSVMVFTGCDLALDGFDVDSTYMVGMDDPTASQGEDGDTYLNRTTGVIFKKVDGAWIIALADKDTGSEKSLVYDANDVLLGTLLQAHSYWVYLVTETGYIVQLGWGGSFEFNSQEKIYYDIYNTGLNGAGIDVALVYNAVQGYGKMVWTSPRDGILRKFKYLDDHNMPIPNETITSLRSYSYTGGTYKNQDIAYDPNNCKFYEVEEATWEEVGFPSQIYGPIWVDWK